MSKETYKQKVLTAIINEKLANNESLDHCSKSYRNLGCNRANCDLYQGYLKKNTQLTTVYKRVSVLPTSVFTPRRFQEGFEGAAFRSIKLSIPDIIQEIYGN